MTSLKRTNYPQLPTPGGPYVHAVRHGDRLYVSGLTAFATDAQGLSAPEQTQEIRTAGDHRRQRRRESQGID